MRLTPLTSLSWAYQLHYYLCFQTHSKRPLFSSGSHAEALSNQISEICARNDYHLLESSIYSDHVRCLISLRPARSVAKVVQIIKTNASRFAAEHLGLQAPIWARGYLARGVGRVRIDAVRNYLEQQSRHHGYDQCVLPPVYRYRQSQVVHLSTPHASFDLTHHLVFATAWRRGLVTSTIGRALTAYWLRVAGKHGFVIDQVSVVPDHTHLIVKTAPKLKLEDCALALLNNSQYFIASEYPRLLVDAGVDRVWQPSASAGTRGKFTTALLKSWLAQPA